MGKNEFEKLCNDFEKIAHLLAVMSRSSAENSAWLDIDILKKYHMEMSYALDFIADIVKEKCDKFSILIEDITEN